ncbi:MAG: hypothetical protein JWN04_455 [Myxococcaceae bacterium]|nr:hypothetical protein [Myxococcaceae bacterium]
MVLLSLVICSAAGSVRAQAPQQNALARALFEEGVALADQHDWSAAADRFSRAYSLKPTSGIAFNWASVLVESGRLLEAQDLFIGVLRDPVADPQLKTQSEAVLTALVPRIAHLRVHVGGQTDEHTTLEVDGLGWPRAAWDIASPINPGAHTVVLKAAGVEAARAELTLQDGQSREVALQISRPAAPPIVALAPAPAPASTMPAPADDRARKPLYKNWAIWTAAGVLAVGGVVTGVLLASKKSAKEEQPVTGNATPGVLTW